jgi:hypothetical protein
MKRLSTLLPLLLLLNIAFGQAAGDYSFLKKNVGPGFGQVWLTPNATDRIGFDGSGGLTTYPAGGGTGDVVGPASSTANNIPQWDGITGKLLKDGLATSTGSNQTADAGKVLIFGPSGGVTAFADGTVSPSGVSAAVIGGPNTNAAIGAQAFDAFAARVVNESTTRPALEAQNDDATNAGPLAHFHRDDNLGMEVANDGGLAWTSATGAATTRVGLALGTLATQSGTFSGTSSGTNTGDQTTIVGITGSLSEFNTALAGADFATGGGTATGTNTGDQTNISGNAATVTTNANLTGPVTSTGNATAIANGAISNAMLANGAVANLSGTNTGDQDLSSYATTSAVAATYMPLDVLLTAKLTSDFTTSSASFVDVTGLAITMPANQTWHVVMDGSYQSTNTSTGVMVSVTRTGSPTRCNCERRVFGTATTNVMHGTVGNIDDVGGSLSTVDAANTDRHWIMTCAVVTSGSACTLQTRVIRQGSANNISIMTGSNIVAYRVP